MTVLDNIYLKLDSPDFGSPELFVKWLRESEHNLFSLQEYIFQEKYQSGFELGHKEGYEVGYDKGYNEGFENCQLNNEKY